MPGEKLGEAVLELRTDGVKFDRGLKTAHKRAIALDKTFKRVGQNLTRFGKSLSMSLTLPLAAFGAAAVKMSADFDKALSQIVGLVGVSRKQVDLWRKDLLDLAPLLGKSPKELAEAMFFVTSAGLRGAEAMDTLVASTKAAVAGLGSAKVVADAVTGVMNAYGSANINAAEAVDILTATVREGKASADSIATSIGRVIPIAAQMGVSFDQVGAIMATLTRINFTADEAMTSFRAIMVSLLKPAKEATDALAAVGMSAEGLRKTIREEGLYVALNRLYDALGRNEAALIKILPESRAVIGALGLLGGEAENTAGIFQSLANAVGSGQTAFEEASKTIAQRFARIVQRLRVSLIMIGDVLGPIIIPMIEKFSNFIAGLADRFSNLAPETKRFAVNVALAALALGPAIMMVGGLIKVFGTLGQVIRLLANPYVLIAAAAIGLVVIIVKNWEKIKAATLKLGKGLQKIWVGIKTIIVGVVVGIYKQVKGWLIDKFETILTWLKLTWAKVSNVYMKARNFIVELLGGEGKPLVPIRQLERDLERLRGFGDKLIAEGKRQLQESIATGTALLKEGGQEIAVVFTDAFDAAKEKAIEMFTKIKSLVGNMSGTIKGLFGAGAFGTAGLAELEARIQEILNRLSGGGRAGPTPAAAPAIGGGGTGMARFELIPQKFRRALEKATEAVAHFAVEIGIRALQTIGSAAQSLGQHLLSLFTSTDEFKNFIEKINESLSKILSQAVGPLLNALSPLIDIFIQLLTNVMPIFIQIFQMLGALIQETLPFWKAIADVIGIVVHIIGAMLSPLLAALVPILNAFAPILDIVAQIFALLEKPLVIFATIVGKVGAVIGWLLTKIVAFGKVIWYAVTFQWRKIKRIDWGGTLKDALNRVSTGLTIEPYVPPTGAGGAGGAGGAAGTAGVGATYEQARPIEVNIDVHDNTIAGNTLREFAILLRQEFESLAILGM